MLTAATAATAATADWVATVETAATPAMGVCCSSSVTGEPTVQAATAATAETPEGQLAAGMVLTVTLVGPTVAMAAMAAKTARAVLAGMVVRWGAAALAARREPMVSAAPSWSPPSLTVAEAARVLTAL